MKTSDVVTIKAGTPDPNFPDLTIGGFKAVVLSYNEHDKMVFVRLLDPPQDYLDYVKKRDVDDEIATIMWLNTAQDIIDPTAPQIAGYWVNVKDRLPPPSHYPSHSVPVQVWWSAWKTTDFVQFRYDDNQWIDTSQYMIPLASPDYWLDVTPPQEVQP